MWKVDQGSLSGATAAGYAAALDWTTAELRPKTILLKNTHASASLRYRLSGYAAADGIERELVPETTLDAGVVAEFRYERQWHKLVLQVKNGSGAATYRVDYEGQGA